MDPVRRQAAKLCNEGNEFAKMLSYSEAIRCYSASLLMHPSSAETYANRGYCHFRLGHYVQGIDDSQRAVQIGGGGYWKSALRVAHGYIAIGSLHEAADYLETAVTTSQNQQQQQHSKQFIQKCQALLQHVEWLRVRVNEINAAWGERLWSLAIDLILDVEAHIPQCFELKEQLMRGYLKLGHPDKVIRCVHAINGGGQGRLLSDDETFRATEGGRDETGWTMSVPERNTLALLEAQAFAMTVVQKNVESDGSPLVYPLDAAPAFHNPLPLDEDAIESLRRGTKAGGRNNDDYDDSIAAADATPLKGGETTPSQPPAPPLFSLYDFLGVPMNASEQQLVDVYVDRIASMLSGATATPAKTPQMPLCSGEGFSPGYTADGPPQGVATAPIFEYPDALLAMPAPGSAGGGGAKGGTQGTSRQSLLSGGAARSADEALKKSYAVAYSKAFLVLSDSRLRQLYNGGYAPDTILRVGPSPSSVFCGVDNPRDPSPVGQTVKQCGFWTCCAPVAAVGGLPCWVSWAAWRKLCATGRGASCVAEERTRQSERVVDAMLHSTPWDNF